MTCRKWRLISDLFYTIVHVLLFHINETVMYQFPLTISCYALNDYVDDGFYRNDKQPSYAIQSDGILWFKFIWKTERGDKLQEGDEIQFELNLDKLNIYMAKNGENKKMIFENIDTCEDIQYKFAVAYFLPRIGDAVTLTNVEDLTFQK